MFIKASLSLFFPPPLGGREGKKRETERERLEPKMARRSLTIETINNGPIGPKVRIYLQQIQIFSQGVSDFSLREKF
jgi:hypothetical protein